MIGIKADHTCNVQRNEAVVSFNISYKLSRYLKCLRLDQSNDTCELDDIKFIWLKSLKRVLI